jgi:hypothetical protein
MIMIMMMKYFIDTLCFSIGIPFPKINLSYLTNDNIVISQQRETQLLDSNNNKTKMNEWMLKQ